MDDIINDSTSTTMQDDLELVDTESVTREEPVVEEQVQSEPAQVFTSAKRVQQNSSDDKTMGMLAHLLGMFVGFWGPLIIWLVKKDESPFVDDEAKEALNFQISRMIYWTIVSALSMVFIGFLIMPVLAIFELVVMILGTIEATKGGGYKYPLCIRFIN